MSITVTKKDNTRKILADLQRKELAFVTIAGETMRSDAVGFINNISGNLAGSIKVAPGFTDGIADCEVGPTADYAVYVELGTGVYAVNGNGRKTPWTYQNAQGQWFTTRGSRPYPYMAPAWDKLQPRLDRLYKKALEL